MSLEDAIKIKESLQELEASVERFSWGPTLYFAQQRQQEALKIIRREIKRIKNERTN
jgi:hypothetical protein